MKKESITGYKRKEIALEDVADGCNTWRKLIDSEIKSENDSWDNLMASTLSDKELDTEFDSNGWINGMQFVVTTKNRVYYPIAFCRCLIGDFAYKRRIRSRPRNIINPPKQKRWNSEKK